MDAREKCENHLDAYIYGSDSQPRKALVTSAVGDGYFENWKRRSSKSWEDYADKIGASIIVLRQSVQDAQTDARPISWEKLIVPEVLSKFFPDLNQVCLIDTDILIGPFAPDIFSLQNPGSYAVVSQEQNMPFPRGGVRQRIAALRKHFYDSQYPLDSLLQASAQSVFEQQGLAVFEDYFCAGLIVCDESLFGDLATAYNSATTGFVDDSFAWEEPWINAWIQAQEPTWLPYEFQAMWLFEMAWNYPFLYRHGKNLGAAAEAAEAVTASLWNNHFLHFAGSWPEKLAWGAIKGHSVLQSENLMSTYQESRQALFTGQSRGKLTPAD